MKFRTTLILVAVFAAALAVVLIFESKGRSDKAKKEKADKLIDLASADITKISLKAEGETITLSRDDKGEWQMTEPLAAKADSYEANSLAESFSSLRIERVVETEPGDLKTYEIPKKEVDVWTKGQAQPVKVLIGMENPIDKTLFAKREDEKRVVLLASSLKTTLDKKAFDFRQKDIFKFETSGVQSVRVRAGEVRWEAAKEEESWMLRAPVRALANNSKIQTLLDSLSGLKAKDFLSEDKKPEDVQKYGLDKPEYEVAVSIPTANKDVVISLHKDGDKMYAMASDSNKIVSFEGSLLTDLEKGIDDLREKKVADFYSWEADLVALKRGEISFSAVKVKEKDVDKWVFDTPGKEPADDSKVESFVRKVEGLEAASFVDSPGSLSVYGLDPPAAEVKIRTKDSENKTKEIVVLIGKEDSDKKQVVVKNAKLDTLFRVDSSFLSELPKEAKDWRPAAEETKEKAPDKK